jgi:DnaJ family protein A protein 3
MRQTCTRCRGTGQFNKNPCVECEGKGANVQRRVVSVTVPPGVANGETLRVQVGRQEVYLTLKVCICECVRTRLVRIGGGQSIFPT